jgi:co-chaperonin GroES (HSP10)
MTPENAQKVNLESTEFKPKNEFILVKPVALETGEKTTASGLVISLKQNTSCLDRPTYGEVIELGDDIDDISIGDYCLWPGTDGLDFEFLDGHFMLLRYTSIIGTRK